MEGARLKSLRFSYDDYAKESNEKYFCFASQKSYKIPQNVLDIMKHGIEMRQETNRGGNKVVYNSLRSNCDIGVMYEGSINEMKEYFAANPDPIKESVPPTGKYILYNMYGGEAGREWVNSIVCNGSAVAIKNSEEGGNREVNVTIDNSKEAAVEGTSWDNPGKAMYGKLLEEIIHFILDGKHPNLRLDDNGLLYSNGRDKAVTWMNSTAYGRPVVPRSGYIVEFNALWYNALKFYLSIASANGREKESAELEELAKTCGESLVNTFLNDYGYLFDYVDGNMIDWSVRPNMIFAVAFDYSPLSKEQKRSVLDVCTRELLTPKGLRSLSPKSGGYNPMYVGHQTQRDYAYHQGTAWPWLGGFYMEACLKLYKNTRLSFI